MVFGSGSTKPRCLPHLASDPRVLELLQAAGTQLEIQQANCPQAPSVARGSFPSYPDPPQPTWTDSPFPVVTFPSL